SEERRWARQGEGEWGGKEMGKPGRVEPARHADNFMLGQTAALLQRPHHGVERVGNTDHERVRRILLDARSDLTHDLEVDVEQVVAAHAGLARNTGSDNAHIGALDGIVGIGAGKFGVEIVHWRCLGDIERLALRNALHDVEHHDVTKFFQSNEVGQRAANLADADQRNLVTRHGGKALDLCGRHDWRSNCGWLAGQAEPDNNQKLMSFWHSSSCIHYTRMTLCPEASHDPAARSARSALRSRQSLSYRHRLRAADRARAQDRIANASQSNVTPCV